MKWICVVDVCHDPSGENNDFNHEYCGRGCDYCDDQRGYGEAYCGLFEKELKNDQNQYGDGGVRRCSQCVDFFYPPEDFQMRECK